MKITDLLHTANDQSAFILGKKTAVQLNVCSSMFTSLSVS